MAADHTRLGAALLPDDGNVGSALRADFDAFVALQAHMAATAAQWRGCGSYLIGPDSLGYEPCMYAKQRLLFERAAALPPGSEALEVGVHGGHSALIMLLANPTLRLTAIDVCVWAHTEPCVAELNRRFGGRVQLIRATGEAGMRALAEAGASAGRFALLHIDGDHRIESIMGDARASLPLARPGATYVFDDYDASVAAVLDRLGAWDVDAIPDCRWRNCVATLRLPLDGPKGASGIL